MTLDVFLEFKRDFPAKIALRFIRKKIALKTVDLPRRWLSPPYCWRGIALLRLKPKTFFGISHQSWSSDELCIDLSHYSKGVAFPKHEHRDPYFCFVLDGICEERTGGRCEPLKPGSLVFHPAGIEHSNKWHEQGRCMHVEFVPSFCEEINRVRLSDPIWHTDGGRACLVARNIYKELLNRDSVSGIAFEGLTYLLLAETVRECVRDSKVPIWLRRVRDRLHEEYEIVPSLKQLAADVGVHPTYLASSFHKHFGMSIGEFVRLRRIDRARDLLDKTDQPLSEVALLLGFSDQSHFCRVFKKQTGYSPLEYRRFSTGNPNRVQES
ncbi:helix-turn-helix domain-containing protein [Telmatocola sphagniphila]|uniref:Helix-turn-helix domain-containing protein n=1 Tax=Telmatocola sphagniphila TaxID=1123043 RepID=A0A8E6B1K5_9BACT|nr:AraC family transcriptional regulator [Telmatocola sphagniphila]QVL30330.1 helix-turn-helix domain-containing protein [Telmatocola sphagniphila]